MTDRRRPVSRRADAYPRIDRHQMYTRRNERGRRRLQWPVMVLVTVIFVGMFAQLFVLARMTSQQKQIAAIVKNNFDLTSRRDNLQVTLNQRSNIDSLTERATELGMFYPGSDSVRVVHVSVASAQSDTNAQTAYGGENP